MEDLSKFTDQELSDRWRDHYNMNRKLRSELERRGYRLEWKPTGTARAWTYGRKVADQAPTDYRFTKTEVQVLA